MSVRAAVGFVAPCLPSLADRPPKGVGWIHEIKHDGFRMMVRRNGAGVRLFTRNGYDWTERYPLIRQAAHALRASSFLLDGEAVNCNEHGLPDFNTLRYRKNDRTVFLYAFDLIELDSSDLRRETIEIRKSALLRLLRKSDYGIFLSEHIEDDAAIVFQHACRLGLEGIVSKRRGLAVSVGALTALAQAEKSKQRCGQAGGGRRVGLSAKPLAALNCQSFAQGRIEEFAGLTELAR